MKPHTSRLPKGYTKKEKMQTITVCGDWKPQWSKLGWGIASGAGGFIVPLIGNVWSTFFVIGKKITIYSPMLAITFKAWVIKEHPNQWPSVDIKGLNRAGVGIKCLKSTLRSQPQFPMYRTPWERCGWRLAQKWKFSSQNRQLCPPGNQKLNSSPIRHKGWGFMEIPCCKNTHIDMKMYSYSV